MIYECRRNISLINIEFFVKHPQIILKKTVYKSCEVCYNTNGLFLHLHNHMKTMKRGMDHENIGKYLQLRAVSG